MIHTVAYAETLPFPIVATQQRGSLSSWLQRPFLALTSSGVIPHLQSSGGRRIWERPDQLCVNTLVPHTALFLVMKSTESPPSVVFSTLAQQFCPDGVTRLTVWFSQESQTVWRHGHMKGGQVVVGIACGSWRQPKAQRESWYASLCGLNIQHCIHCRLLWILFLTCTQTPDLASLYPRQQLCATHGAVCVPSSAAHGAKMQERSERRAKGGKRVRDRRTCRAWEVPWKQITDLPSWLFSVSVGQR